jgi:hypothetical protein
MSSSAVRAARYGGDVSYERRASVIARQAPPKIAVKMRVKNRTAKQQQLRTSASGGKSAPARAPTGHLYLPGAQNRAMLLTKGYLVPRGPSPVQDADCWHRSVCVRAERLKRRAACEMERQNQIRIADRRRLRRRWRDVEAAPISTLLGGSFAAKKMEALQRRLAPLSPSPSPSPSKASPRRRKVIKAQSESPPPPQMQQLSELSLVE